MIGGTIVTREVDVATVEEDRRRETYLAEIDHSLATTFLSDPIHARLKVCHLGPMRIIELDASPRRSDRTPALIARDRHDGVSAQLAISGSSIGDAAGRRVVSTPGTVMLLDFAQPFYMVDQSPRTVLNVAIPRTMLAAHVDDLRSLHGRVLDPAASTMLAGYLRAIPAGIAHLSGDAAPVLCDIVVDLLLLALGRDPRQPMSTPDDRRATLFERATRLIDSRLGSKDMTPEWLAARLSVSRSELYVAFEEVDGIARFIWRRRLEAAHAALLDPIDTRRIGEIAFAFGFSSEAHFARAFRGTYGRTASETRRARVPV